MAAVNLSYMAFIMLRYILSIPIFFRVFVIKGCWILSIFFAYYWDDCTIFIFHSMNVFYHVYMYVDRHTYMGVHAQSLQSCLTLCDPMDCSPPGSSVEGIRQAGILEWVAMPSYKGSSLPRDWTTSLVLLHWQADSLLLAPSGMPRTPTHIHILIHTDIYIYIMKHYCHKKKGSPAISKMWMNLEGIMLSEINQIKKDKYCMTSVICEIWKSQTHRNWE